MTVMADQLEVLKQLQVLDGKIFFLRKQQENKPRELEEMKAQVAAQEANVKSADARLKTLQLAQKEKEVELQSREANIKKLQGQLFQVKTNKEYTTMQREIDTIKADNSVLEETILGAFDAIEQATRERQREQAVFAEQQQRLRAEEQRMIQELAEIQTQVDRLERDRAALVPGVPAEALRVYQRVLEIREGLALVPLLKDMCGGCHRRLPPQVVNRVLLKAALVTCESCSRILYLDDAQSVL